jgi:hypothetical protein
MSVTEKFPITKSFFQIALPGEMTLLAIIAFLFLALHVAAGVLLQNALPDVPATTQQAAVLSSHD